LHGLRAEAYVYNLDGSLHLRKSSALDCPANNAQQCFNLFAGDDPKSPQVSDVYFIRLELKDAAGATLSNNFYWNAKEVWKYKDLASMNKAEVSGNVKRALQGETCKFKVDLANTNKAVALMVRVKMMDSAAELLVAPVIYTENYFSLVPGESRQITIECRADKIAGKEVKVMIEGWNVTEKELPAA
jgi:hypothetical protein